ncbi:MAG: magnesium and cobalt transporter [Gammaproteobacteria bacterium]|jgi:magnesium and cobalt transporter
MSSRDGPSWLERLGQVLSGEPQNRDELVEILRDAQARGMVDVDVLAIVEGALHVGDLQVRDIMIPRSQMVVVRADAAPEAFVKVVVESGHSRFPVVGDNRDQVEGVLLAKDLLAYFATDDEKNLDLDDVMRPVVYVPESKRLNVLLAEFRANRNHMAIVVDEYGGVAGLVTIEDVIEQIVGEIDDEHDGEDEEGYIRRLGNGEHTVKALTPIEDFNAFFDTSIDDDEFDTVGGLVIKAFGHLPKRGESMEAEGFHFNVLRADQRRVHLLRVVPGTSVDD